MTRFVLAVDAGTTSTRCLVVDDEGRVRASASRPITQYFPQPGWVEHDPEEIFHAVVATMRHALANAGLHARDVAAVGVATQRETVVAWERRSGRPVHRALVWQDRRTTDRCAELEREGAGPWVHERTGLRLDPYFSATKIAWLLDHVPGLRARATRGEICVGTVDSWILWRLSERRVHATDVTNASRTSLMDLRRATWDDELCQLFRVPREVLARIEPSQTDFVETDADVLGASVPVTGVLGDQQAALLGQGCVREGQAKNTYGTGSFVLRHSGAHAHTGGTSLLVTAVAGDEGSTPRYALEGSIFVTGAALQWLRDGLGILDTADQSEALAASLPDNGDVWFVPALTGLGAPHWDPRARGAVVGITRGTTRAHLARAALESIAYQTRDVIDAMNLQTGSSLPELLVDGGASANRWLMQFQSDVLGVPVVVAAHAEATALGAAYAAGVHARLWRDHEEVAALGAPGVRYEPTMDPSRREALYARWDQALARARDWSA